MKNKKIITAVLSLSMAFTMSIQIQTDKVSATTVDDVIAYARSVGMPEEQVQYYINMGSGGTYTSEQCDKAIGMLASYYADRDAAIGGGSSEPESAPVEPDESVELDMPEEPDVPTEPDESEEQDTLEESDTPAASTPTIPSEEEKEKFESMDVHEKKDYVNSLPQEDKKSYLDMMTNEEKNQLVKEMSPSEQVGIISGMLGVGDAFGYQFAVENVSDGAIMLSARDDEGKLVGVTVLGDSVEKTGKPYLIPIAACTGLIAFSATGMYMLIRKCRED